MALPKTQAGKTKQEALSRLILVLSGGQGKGQKSQAEVHYRVATDPSKSCAACEHFRPSAVGATSGTCELVAGPIHPGGLCDLFAPQGEDSRPDNDNDAEDQAEQAVRGGA